MTGAESRTESGALGRLGFRPGQVVIEYGYDDDVDETFREQVEDATASPLEDEDFDGVVDAVLLWWRDGDGDLGDDLMDAIATLEDGGFIALLTPGTGRLDRVPAADVQDSCNAVGLTSTAAQPVGAGEWVVQRLVGRR